MKVRIVGAGASVPPVVMSNERLQNIPGTPQAAMETNKFRKDDRDS